MRHLLSVFAVLLLWSASAAVHAAPAGGISAKRLPGESFDRAMERALEQFGGMESLSQQEEAGPSAYSSSGPYGALKIESVPEWTSQSLISQAFEFIRDFRFLPDAEKEGFLRRISWLYPDDGCFARAALIKDRVTNKLNLPSARIFIFGDLSVETPNSPMGRVEWWYHTAFVVRSENQVMVFDPAIEPKRPLQLEEWVLKQVPSLEQAQLSICSANTYGPSNPCETSEDPSATAYDDIGSYLYYERYRQRELQRDPDEVLGDSPPWRNGLLEWIPLPQAQ